MRLLYGECSFCRAQDMAGEMTVEDLSGGDFFQINF